MVIIVIALIFLYSVLKGVPSGTSGFSMLNSGTSAYGPTGVKNKLLPIDNNSPIGTSEPSSVSTTVVPTAGAEVGDLTISSENASNENEPSMEYITIKNNSNHNIDITGMYVRNGKGLKPIANDNNQYFYPTANSVKIGQGVKFLSPEKNFVYSDIILEPGDEAHIVSGGPGSFPFTMPSAFQNNICTGYLLETNKYSFKPKFERNCPDIADSGLSTMVVECRDYVSSLDTCEIPEVTDKTTFDSQYSLCREYIRGRTSYVGCVENNKLNEGFYEKEWYVFLYQNHELWADQYETIMLLDKSGKLIDKYDY